MAAAQEGDDPRRPAAVKKGALGQPWSHAETMHLIDVYEDQWTKLRRGKLMAHQWEDVAAEVTARCSGIPGSRRKVGTQCRHKLEKLRVRYRTEGARPVASHWPFFRRMDRLERGPGPVSASPPSAASDEEEPEEEDDEEQEEEEPEPELIPPKNTRSINCILHDCGGFMGPRPPPQLPPPPAMMLSTAPPRKRVAYEAFHSMAAEDNVKVEAGEGVSSQFSGVLRDFSEGIRRMERRRLEVQWEVQRAWKETAVRHSKMLQDAQSQLVDTLAAASTAPVPGKKARRDHDSTAEVP